LGIGEQLLMFLYIVVCSTMFFGIFFWALNRQRVQSQRATEIIISLPSDSPQTHVESCSIPFHCINEKLSVRNQSPYQVGESKAVDKVSVEYDKSWVISQETYHLDSSSVDSYSSEVESTSHSSFWSLSLASQRVSIRSIRSLQSSKRNSFRSVMSYVNSVFDSDIDNSWSLSESSSLPISMSESAQSYSRYFTERSLAAAGDALSRKENEDAISDAWSNFSDHSFLCHPIDGA
jgi:hypothetical protein